MKNIHTTLDEDTWKLAVVHDIKWFKALKFGIESMANMPKEKEALIKEKELLEGKIKYIEQALKTIDKQEQEKKEKNKEKIYKDFGE